jgi:hypothetical protein
MPVIELQFLCRLEALEGFLVPALVEKEATEVVLCIRYFRKALSNCGAGRWSALAGSSDAQYDHRIRERDLPDGTTKRIAESHRGVTSLWSKDDPCRCR